MNGKATCPQGCGSAVLTALQAPYKTIDELAALTRKRIITAFMRGADITEWWSEFWRVYGLQEARRVGAKICK